MIPDPKDGQAIFLPFSTMLTTNVQQPFQLVSLKSITFFMNEEVGSVSAPVHSFTPAIAKQTARSAMDSEGATTVGSVSSISTIGTETSHMNTYHISEKIYKVVLDHTTPRVRNGRPPKASNQNPIPMAVASSSSSANISSAGSSAVDLVTANSHITGIGMLEESKPKQQSQANAKVVVKKNLQIAGYGIDLQDGKLVDESIEAKLK